LQFIFNIYIENRKSDSNKHGKEKTKYRPVRLWLRWQWIVRGVAQNTHHAGQQSKNMCERQAESETDEHGSFHVSCRRYSGRPKYQRGCRTD